MKEKKNGKTAALIVLSSLPRRFVCGVWHEGAPCNGVFRNSAKRPCDVGLRAAVLAIIHRWKTGCGSTYVQDNERVDMTDSAKRAHADRMVVEAVQRRQQREMSYREQALKLFPWVCGRCAREFIIIGQVV